MSNFFALSLSFSGGFFVRSYVRIAATYSSLLFTHGVRKLPHNQAKNEIEPAHNRIHQLENSVNNPNKSNDYGHSDNETVN